MKVLILDADQAHNHRLEVAFKDDPKIQLVFCQQMDDLLEIVNANPSFEVKLKRMEKTLVDGAAMLAKTMDAINKANALVAEKSSREKQTPQPEVKAQLIKEVDLLKSQILASEDLKRKIELALAARKKEIEALAGMKMKDDERKVDLILVDRAYLGNLPSEWNLELRRRIDFAENKEVPVIAMGYNEDLNYIKSTLHGGVNNYFVKPVDFLLLKHNFNKILKLNDAEGKVFEVQTKTEVKILKIASVLKLSEFELYVQADAPFRAHELVEFYVDIFAGEKDKRVLALCESSAPAEGVAGAFNSTFVIVGHTPHTMTEMRKWIRARYVAAKKEESA